MNITMKSYLWKKLFTRYDKKYGKSSMFFGAVHSQKGVSLSDCKLAAEWFIQKAG